MNEQNELQKLIEIVTALANRVSAIEERGGAGRRTVWELTQIMEAKQKVCDKLKMDGSFDAAMETEWTNMEMKAKFYAIRKEINALNAEIAAMK